MIDLVANSAQGKVALRSVAKRQAISEKYLWQIASRLKAAGLISAISGASGGFIVSKPAKEITLADILAALEGELTLVPCVRKSSVCSRSAACAAREVWQEINMKMTEAMKAITLSDMAQKQQALTKHCVTEYDI